MINRESVEEVVDEASGSHEVKGPDKEEVPHLQAKAAGKRLAIGIGEAGMFFDPSKPEQIEALKHTFLISIGNRVQAQETLDVLKALVAEVEQGFESKQFAEPIDD